MYQFKKFTYLSYVTTDSALFLNFGNRVLVKASTADQWMDSFFSELQSPRTEEILAAQFEKHLNSIQLKGLLNQLLKTGLLLQLDAGHSSNSKTSPFFEQFTSDESTVKKWTEKIKAKQVLIFNLSDFPVNDLGELLKTGGFEKIEIRNDLSNLEMDAGIQPVVLINWFQTNLLQNLNQKFFSKNISWLPVFFDPFGASMGPVLGIQDGPCFNCLIERRNSHLNSLESQTLLENSALAEQKNLIFIPKHFSISIFSSLVTELLKLTAPFMISKLENGMMEFDLLNHRTSFHVVYQIPVCSVCGPTHKIPMQMLNTGVDI